MSAGRISAEPLRLEVTDTQGERAVTGNTRNDCGTAQGDDITAMVIRYRGRDGA